ncbi:uncharacterized protein GGS22DRAFT_77821 [Annulohypoxylon maeteangense]|uniref:uncharacterized protein n=1 Tax=Annulohypoxylon maeteangense TaxID=1927788 RepID=UPI002008AA61|nr:uncharacterized protein GGS22DRAFT_77821 [Annulohypoxylon maeteangense]KAI0880896.1 hypothetical protein GGS22DRAFT_77821 [Annulohypoxylon maeteangense]
MPSTSLPFLYHTRTILRTNPRKAVTFARALHATNRQCVKGSDDIPFVFNSEEEEILSTPPPKPPRRATITPYERQIFERIFADIKARGLKPSYYKETPSDRSTMLIMQQAAQDAGQSRPATVAAPGLLAGAAKDRQKALLRFPAELRAAASRALDTIHATAPPGEEDSFTVDEGRKKATADEGWKTPAHTINRTLELEAKRRPERVRVEGLIFNARTDFELWDVLEKEVFTMPARLGIGRKVKVDEEVEEVVEVVEEGEDVAVDEVASESEEAIDTPESSEVLESALEDNLAKAEDALEATEDTLEETEDAAADPITNNNIPPEELSLYIYGPLYPAYLLLALRRLDTAFSVPSPLVFSLLPRIKELGLESYILGVSTPFYNDLLEIHWNHHGDLVGILNLLEEMRYCGLYFDEQTASILNQVDAAATGLATKVTSGSFTRALMTMPDYERSVRDRLRHWHRIVDLSIKEKENDIGY